VKKDKKKPARVLAYSSRQGGKNNGEAINPVYIVTQASGFCKRCHDENC